jgi:cytochrome c oxidase assembly factor CtaG
MMRRLMLAGALLAIALIVLPPLSRDSESLFSAHMVQHLLLIAVAAPLLAAGGWLDPLARGPARALMRPSIAWSAFVFVFLFWHWPAAFQWAAITEPTRLLEHATILVAACLFWATALAPSNPGRLSDGARALFVMTAAVVTDLPGVIMLFAPRAICTMPGENAFAFGLSPIEDQQIAGVLMWVPANLVFFGVATWLFARWISGAPSSSPTDHLVHS